jgi:hypothetical protein
MQYAFSPKTIVSKAGKISIHVSTSAMDVTYERIHFGNKDVYY